MIRSTDIVGVYMGHMLDMTFTPDQYHYRVYIDLITTNRVCA